MSLQDKINKEEKKNNKLHRKIIDINNAYLFILVAVNSFGSYFAESLQMGLATTH